MNATRCLALTLLSLLTIGFAQAEDPASPPPGSEDLIQALKPKPRTRNLLIQPSAPGDANPAETKTKPVPATVGNKTIPPVAMPAGPAPSISLTINFETNSSKVSADSQQTLANLARALRSTELASSRFLIEGHTDAKGSATYNMRLSQRRAEQVRRDLIVRGVESRRLVARGVGSADPANPSDATAPENRRVRIVNLDQN